MAFVQAAKGGKIFGNDHLRFLRQGSNNISTTHDTTTATRKMQESQEQLTNILEPSKSPTTSPAPTATLQPTCLRITTGTGTFHN